MAYPQIAPKALTRTPESRGPYARCAGHRAIEGTGVARLYTDLWDHFLSGEGVGFLHGGPLYYRTTGRREPGGAVTERIMSFASVAAKWRGC